MATRLINKTLNELARREQGKYNGTKKQQIIFKQTNTDADRERG